MRKHVDGCASRYFAVTSMEMWQRPRCHIGSAWRTLGWGGQLLQGKAHFQPALLSRGLREAGLYQSNKVQKQEKKGTDDKCRLAVDQRPLNNAAAGQESKKRRERGGTQCDKHLCSVSEPFYFLHPLCVMNIYLCSLGHFGNH